MKDSQIIRHHEAVHARVLESMRFASFTEGYFKFPRPHMQLLPLVPRFRAQKLEHFKARSTKDLRFAFSNVRTAVLGCKWLWGTSYD